MNTAKEEEGSCLNVNTQQESQTPRKKRGNAGKLKRKELKSRSAWLKARQSGIGASEAAAVVGLSPWLTATELWELKTGIKEDKDKSDDEFISQGVRLEPVLRDLFGATHPDYTIEYHPYGILYQSDRPWLFATLDGELTDKDGRKGILEIKTATPNGKAGWAKWDNQIPQQYFVQIVHQLLATKYDYAILYAALFNQEGNIFIREYSLEAEDAEMDMEWLLGRETEFWQSVESKSVPAMSIAF